MANEQKSSGKVKISFKQMLQMLYPYTKNRIMDQIKSVWIIVAYLIVFQVFILGIPIDKATIIALGISLVIFGLAFFMEGLNLGLMPLGETAGVKMPQKSHFSVILIFAFILGIGATYAEPAIGVLKAAGSSVRAWEAPLLFLMLNKNSGMLVLSVGVGVGIAVLFGMLRFLYNWSLKPFIYVLVSTLLGISLWGLFDKNFMYLSGLAWDCGGVTTGPVTVPLVLALGIGISRIVGGKDSGAGGGFGVVTLASAFPIIAVYALGFVFNATTPAPMTINEFLKAENRETVKVLFVDDDDMNTYVLKNAALEHRLALFENDTQKYQAYLTKINNDEKIISSYFGDREKFGRWLFNSHSMDELLPVLGSQEKYNELHKKFSGSSEAPLDLLKTLKINIMGALQAILPLSIFLIFVIIVVLREKLSRADEVILGLIFAVIGMTLFNIGIELGLSRLGNQVGEKLPSSFKSISLPEQKRVISNFDLSLVNKAVKPDGSIEKFFYNKKTLQYETIPYNDEMYDQSTGQYTHIPKKGPLFGVEGSIIGILVVLLFAFFMGYGATLAEPALNALGSTVEELTVGTFKKSLLMSTVAIGVGLGMFFGVAKIVWGFPLVYLLAPPYLVLLFLTKISNEDFVNIGWDSAGVTTGPITVPLVLAMGLGIGGQVGVVEGFGILASASVFPILAVLSVGLYVNYRRKKVLKDAQ